jgi:hypothetical protein
MGLASKLLTYTLGVTTRDNSFKSIISFTIGKDKSSGLKGE